MNTPRFAQLTPLCAALLASLALPGAAQRQAPDRDVLQWSGTVDREVRLVLHGSTVSIQNVGAAEPRNPLGRVVSAVPRADGLVAIDPISGRGTVDVIQQPTSANDYTAVVRVRDDFGGASAYRFNVRWQAAANGEVGPPYGRGRGRGNRGLERTALGWTGDIDTDTYIRFRTGSLTYSVVSGASPRVIAANLITVPTGETLLRLTDLNGRGEVVIVQQPMASNGYVAVIRIRDPESGYGRYSFNVTW